MKARTVVLSSILRVIRADLAGRVYLHGDEVIHGLRSYNRVPAQLRQHVPFHTLSRRILALQLQPGQTALHKIVDVPSSPSGARTEIEELPMKGKISVVEVVSEIVRRCHTRYRVAGSIVAALGYCPVFNTER